MRWRRAAALAIIPWTATMAIILLAINRDGIAGDGSWSNYLFRMSGIALVLYGAMTSVLADDRPSARKGG